MADDGDLFFYALIGFFAGIYFFVKGFKWLKFQRLIENLPTSKVRSLAMGLVEVFGIAVPNKMLKSPFSNKDCVYYKFFIEEERHSKNSTYWAVIKQGVDGFPFYLKDDTGSVLVDPKGADLDLVQDNYYISGIGKTAPAKVLDFLNKNNMESTNFLGFNKKMRYREYFIEPNDKVYIIGSAGDNPYVKDGSAKYNHEDIMIQKNKNDPIYLITDKDERQVLSSLQWKVMGGIYGGAVLTVICLTVMLSYLGLLF